MKIHRLIFMQLLRRVACARRPDFVIGGMDRPYLKRWHVLPRNPIVNVYLHQFLRSDDDRALHDHPWWNCSFLLDGTYLEHTIAAGGVNSKMQYRAGDLKFRRAKAAHRVELVKNSHGLEEPAWSLFVTGPRIRDWGFHCAEAGWIPWQRFTAKNDKGQVGPGCDG